MEKSNLTALEELKNKHDTPDAVFEGVKAANGWKTGKAVAESEYVKAVQKFKDASVDGRTEKKVVKK